MGISPGTRLGPYEIVALLGAGGMGAVYRARDTRLSRDVALKTLLPDALGDLGRRQRFEQEGRAVAALNHPNIIGIYDADTIDNVTYLVSELVEGEPLTALIARGPIPLRKLLDIAIQIADGLAAAHAARIVHRDLKPDNIMLARDGRVKILDFGLARQSGITEQAPDKTMTVHLTQPGMIMGTVSYMSPEQATGRAVDYRSDQFSLGLILYEMASGKKAFDKKESVQVMSAIITDEPAPMDIPIPAPLRWIIDRCLAKEPEGRYESTRDLYQELRGVREHLTETSSATTSAAAAPLAKKPKRWPAWIACALAVVGAFAAGRLLLPENENSLGSYRFVPFAVDREGQMGPVWSPDGKGIAFRGFVNGQSQVFVRYLDSPTVVRVTKIPQSARPFGWTPDSRRIFFLSIGREPSGVWSIAAVGGEPQSVLPLGPESQSVTWNAVTIAPDGKSLAALRSGPDGAVSVWISSPVGSPLKPYLPAPFATRNVQNTPYISFSPDSAHLLLYINARRHGEEAWILPYPPGTGSPPREVLPSAPTSSGTPQFGWMPDSRRLVLSGAYDMGAPVHLWMADTASGKVTALTTGTGNHGSPAVSPDGRTIAFTEGMSDYDVVSVSLKTAAVQTLIATDRNETMPAWAANQQKIVFVTDRNGPSEIWIRSGDGTERPLVSVRDFPGGRTQWFVAPMLSPDGERVIYMHVDLDGHNKLWMSAVSGGLPVRLTNSGSESEFSGSWSPEGSWFAYGTVHDSKFSLMKVKTSGQATPVLLKPGGGKGIVSWSPAGDWIVYPDEAGYALISPDGKTERSLGKFDSPHLTFSKDGKRLFGMREGGGKVILFSVDVVSGAVSDIGDVGMSAAPRSNLNPGIHFSVAPDGESLAYGTARSSSNLWLLEGFDRKMGLMERLGFQR